MQKIQRGHRARDGKKRSKLKESNRSGPSDSFFLNPIDQYEAINIILGLKETHAQGEDEISMEVFKKYDKWIFIAVAFIINLFFLYGVFPIDLRKAKVMSPIYKSKGSIREPGNHRPILVLSNVSKIFETAIKNRLMS